MNKHYQLTSRESDFSKWYNEIVEKADLAEHSPVKGCMIIKPYGYAIWEKMQYHLNKMIKSHGVKNAYFPIFIPQSFLQREKEHVEGFSPELAVVTHGGGKKLDEPLVVRPTSETIMYDTYSRWISSYRDLPLLINQWANVVRWEKRPRLFLRTTEFLWQEGHTAHADADEAIEFTTAMLNMYAQFAEDFLAMPVIKGRKSENEKFAGAVHTDSIEALMPDGKGLQSGTSHYLGTNFASAFNIQYTDEDNQQQLVHQTSWGVSTRLIGGLIMIHGDDKGLRLPPNIAPIQIVIVPIFKNESEEKSVREAVTRISSDLKKYSVFIDDDDQKSPGWKFNEWEQKGVPVRIEVGPKDIAKEQVVLFRRDTNEKITVQMKDIVSQIDKVLIDIQTNLFEQAKDNLENNSHEISDWNEFKKQIENDPGFIYSPWCGQSNCENDIKELTKATIRHLPFDQPEGKYKCIKCGQPAKIRAVFGLAY